MNTDKKLTRFEIYSGKPNGQELDSPVHVGVARIRDGEKYFTLNLKRVVPRKLYVVKNVDSLRDFTVYCGFDPTRAETPFCFSCGTGVLHEDFQGFMELNIKALSCPVYMSLFETKEVA